MPRPSRSAPELGVALALGLILVGSTPSIAQSPTASIAGPGPTGRYPIPHASPDQAIHGRPATPSLLGTTSSALLLLLVGAGAAIWVLRRNSAAQALARPSAGPDSIRVVTRAAIAPRQAVVLVQVGARRLLLGVGTQGPPALLAEWPAQTPDAEAGPP